MSAKAAEEAQEDNGSHVSETDPGDSEAEVEVVSQTDDGKDAEEAQGASKEDAEGARGASTEEAKEEERTRPKRKAAEEGESNRRSKK
jgi:hypothetical protein